MWLLKNRREVWLKGGLKDGFWGWVLGVCLGFILKSVSKKTTLAKVSIYKGFIRFFIPPKKQKIWIFRCCAILFIVVIEAQRLLCYGKPNGLGLHFEN